MNMKNCTKKISIKSKNGLDNLNYEKLLYPVIMYGKEKMKNNMYDDWDEYKHTLKMLSGLDFSKNIKINIYVLKKDSLVIGICFFISGKNYMKKFLEQTEETNYSITDKSAQLTCFHILEKYRGIGTQWLEEAIFPDLKENSIEYIYVKSSHNRALHLYQRLRRTNRTIYWY